MLRIVGCLTFEHDLALVLLAALICVLGSFASLAVAARVRGARYGLWLLLLSMCAGSTVWATHFIAMLAYRTSLPTTYAPLLTVLSYVLGTVVMGTGFALALRARRRPRTTLVAGAVVGLGVSLLHYLGMAAMRIPGEMRFDADLVAASLLLSCGFGAAALHAALCRPGRQFTPPAALLAVAMIVSLHFTGMGAIRLEIGSIEPDAIDGLSRQMLVVAVTMAVLVVIAIATAAVTVDRLVSTRLAHLALHDPLTDLPNRRLFAELANKAVHHAHRLGERFAVLAIDLDGFKLVNDVHGHAAGDELLKAVAQRIGAALRENDTLARLGGDEFILLQCHPVKPAQAATLAQRLLELLATPFHLATGEVTISASVGIAMYPDDGLTPDALQRSADTAMYRAKGDGKGTWRLFEQAMDAALESRRRLEMRLRQAIQEHKLHVVYQPQVPSLGGEVVGFEALVRWNDAELGSVPPNDFIPVAEETGLIVALGEFVLRRACHEAVRWPEGISVAVNLSAVQFRRKGLVETVERALADSGLPGDRLELEVTESLLIDNRDEALTTLTALKALGARIAMDDFGTGYSSLRYLQSFPFDKIKIDRAFVAGLESSEQNVSIVRAVASMGQSLQMRVVAEGVETCEQARILKDLRCDELQGYLIARPMPAGEVAGFLARSTQRPDDELAAA